MSNDFIKLSCPGCGKRLKLPTRKLRPKIVCPTCQHTFSMEIAHDDRSVPGQADGVLATQSAKEDPGLAKAERWRKQQQHRAERSQITYRRFCFGLLLLAIAAILAETIGYRFRFLDGLAFGIEGGFGVFYFILLGMVGTFLLARKLPVSRLQFQGIALLASLLLLAGGIVSFLVARSTDASRMAEQPFRQGKVLRSSPSQRSDVLIQRNQPGGGLVRRLPTAEPRQASRFDTPADLTDEKKEGWIDPTDALQPVANARSEETFRPSDAAKDFSVDQLLIDANKNPFKSIDAAELADGAGGSKKGRGELPRSDVVRDLLAYPDKRAALLRRQKKLLPIRVIGGEIEEASQFESFQLGETAGKQTKLGWIYVGSQPCRGLDVLKTSTASEAPFQLVLPIHGRPEFSDSLYHKQGFYLAGMKVNVQDDQVVGIQAVLAPGQENRMDMQNVRTSSWAGQETGAQQFHLTARSGKAVYGIVVYEEQLRIKGIGLIQKK